MAGFLLLVATTLAVPGTSAGITSIDSSNFSVGGWICNEGDCLLDRKQLGEELEFASRDESVFTGFAHQDGRWDVSFSCKIAQSHLLDCKTVEWIGYPKGAKEVAFSIANRIQLAKIYSKGLRAVLIVSYDGSNCPVWRCIPIPPPPPPRPSPAS